MKKVLIALTMIACTSAYAHGQANATASRAGDLQIGLTYTIAQPYYPANRSKGIGAYIDFDFRPHWGAEFNVHQASDPNTDAYERTYEWGGRYIRHYGRLTPYIKGLYGRGVYNFVDAQGHTAANLAYNMAVGGAGVDIAVRRNINVRGDYEYQHWLGFPFSGLNPQLITFGAAYHFGAGKPH